jgi:hypothetical protein
MKPGDRIQLNDTMLDVIEATAGRVRLRYVYPHRSDPIREWFFVNKLTEAGWRVIPAVEVPPCRDV